MFKPEIKKKIDETGRKKNISIWLLVWSNFKIKL